MRAVRHMLPVVLLAVGGCVSTCTSESPSPQSSLVDAMSSVPGLQIDQRYATANNFIGRPIDGYTVGQCRLTRPAAEALARAQTAAAAAGFSLKVYDCFRPQRAVDHFVRWAEDLTDTAMQGRFYPEVPKAELFSRGYIAARSGHSRGSTLDLTLVPLGSAIPTADRPSAAYDCRGITASRYPDNSLDMGTGYDCFDIRSHTDHPEISAEARRNRDLLRAIMQAAGFVNYAQEWWHYTLADEPYPYTYFDEPT